MEIKPLLKKLCIDFTTFYLNNVYDFYLFTIHWKEGVSESEIKGLLEPACLGVLGSFNKKCMHIQVIVEQRNMDYLRKWLHSLLQKSSHVVYYVSGWPGNVHLAPIKLDYKSLELNASSGSDRGFESACDPFFLINKWLSLLLSCDNNSFFFSERLIHKKVYNMHLMYTPLHYLIQKENFIYLDLQYINRMPPYQPRPYYFNCSFAEWWTYPCSPNTVLYHPTLHILNKITECGLYYMVLELDDVSSFLEKLIRYGFENSSIKCSYTLQSPRLRIENKIYLIIGYPVEELADIVQMQNYVLHCLYHLNPVIASDHTLEHLDCLSYPNKVSRSIWTGDFRTCRLLCSTYDCERDGFDLDTLFSNMEPEVEVFSPLKGGKKYCLLPEVQKDVTYMREYKMDFIYVYRHHDPFTKK